MMRKICLITSITILVIIIIIGSFIAGCFLYSISRSTSKTNTKLINDYHMLKHDSYKNFLIAQNINYLLSTENLSNFTDGNLSYIWKTNNKEERGFYCKNKKAEQIRYYFYSAGENVGGGWYYIDILDCEDIYWVIKFSSAGVGPIYGPFTN